jgi:hypothetical protein
MSKDVLNKFERIVEASLRRIDKRALSRVRLESLARTRSEPTDSSIMLSSRLVTFNETDLRALMGLRSQRLRHKSERERLEEESDSIYCEEESLSVLHGLGLHSVSVYLDS